MIRTIQKILSRQGTPAGSTSLGSLHLSTTPIEAHITSCCKLRLSVRATRRTERTARVHNRGLKFCHFQHSNWERLGLMKRKETIVLHKLQSTHEVHLTRLVIPGARYVGPLLRSSSTRSTGTHRKLSVAQKTFNCLPSIAATAVFGNTAVRYASRRRGHLCRAISLRTRLAGRSLVKTWHGHETKLIS